MKKKQQFPKKQFNDILLIQQNIKQKIKPLLDQIINKNILWIYQSISILYFHLTQTTTTPQIQFNSLLAIQYIIETCQFVPIIFIETYIFPIIKNGANYDIYYPQNQRGINFFNYSGQKIINEENLGKKYVKLCTEIVKILSIMKPKTFYYDEQIQEPSIFLIVIEQIQKKIKNKITYNFFNENPQNLKKYFNKNLLQFHDNFSQKYEQYIQWKFHQQMKNSFQNCILDLRQLIHSYDCYSIDTCLKLSADILQRANQWKKIRLALDYINRVLLSGNYLTATFMKEQHQKIKNIIKQVISIQSNTKSLSRGKLFFSGKDGLPEQKRLYYIEFLQALQLWAHVYTKYSVINNKKPSMIAKYYNKLKNEYGFEFPENKNLQNQIKQAQQNYQKKYILNERIKKQPQQNQQQQHQNGQNTQIDLEDSILRGKISSNNQNRNNKSNQNNKKSNQNNNSKSNQNNNNKSNLSNKSKNNQNNNNKSNVSNNNKSNQNNNNYDNYNQNNNYNKNNDNKKIIQNRSIINSNFLIQQSQIIPNDKQQQQYRNMKKNIILSIKNLTTNEKILPDNIKSYQQNYQKLQQFLNDNNMQNNYIQQFNQLQQYHKKINIIYSQYKTSTINYNIFCHKINQINKQSLIQSKNVIINIQDSTTNKVYGSNINHNNNQQINQQINNQTSSQKKSKIQSNQNLSYVKTNKKNQINNSPLQQFSKSQINQQNISNPNQSNQQFNSSKYKKSLFILDSQQNKDKVDKPHRQSQTNPQFILSQQIINSQQKQQKKLNRKFLNDIQLQQNSRVKTYRPITNIQNFSIHSNQSLQSSPKPSIKNKSSRSRVQNFDSYNKMLSLNDQFIEGPSLNPLNYSYHNQPQKDQKSQIHNKSFKQIINNDRMMIKTNKKQNLFWLESESSCLIKSVNKSLKKSKIESRINVPQLLQQCKKKHQKQIQLLQKNKQIKIKQLQNTVNIISQQLKNKTYQLNSRKQHSQLDQYKQKTIIDKYSILEDRKFIQKKLNKAHQQNQQNNQNKRKFIQSIKQSKILAIGQLINTKIYQKYFNKIVNQKQKKIHLKNKQLIYKDNDLQIGYMSQLNNQQYQIMFFVTPQKQFILDYINIQKDDNLQIKHSFKPGMKITAKKQQKVSFFVDIKAVPYEIPQVSISYRLQNIQKSTKFLLPCAFHKFIIIEPLQSQKLLQKFEKSNIIRGQQIPYSRKILKNINLIQDYLPHIQKINKNTTNQFGQYCFGGYSKYIKKIQYNFYIKICVKPNQFLYIQSIDCKNFQCKKIIQFYIATLNHFFMKNITWD